MFRETLSSGSPFAGLIFNPATASVAIADADADTDPGEALQYRNRKGGPNLHAPASSPGRRVGQAGA